MLQPFHEPTSYTHGSWGGRTSSELPRTVNDMLQWGDGCLKGSAPPFIVSQNTYDADLEARVCDRYFTPCWGRPEADTTGRGIRMQTDTLYWRWSPKRDCAFSSVGQISSRWTDPRIGWVAWAHSVEAKLGTSLWVGDEYLEQMYSAWQTLSGGASSHFHRADVLVNSWTLAPMDAQAFRDCALGISSKPCPPTSVSPIPGTLAALGVELDNSFHALPAQEWTKRLHDLVAEGKAPGTLVIGTGSQWWRETHYPSFHPNCRDSDKGAGPHHATEADGFDFFIQGFEAKCKVFDFKYPMMAKNVIRFLANAGWSGDLVVVTTPAPELLNCRSATTPSTATTVAPIPNFQTAGGTLATGFTPIDQAYEKLRSLEQTAWKDAIRFYASGFIELRILDIAELSNQRADLRVPGDCSRFCMPGLPFVWAEMMLRMAEQLGDQT